MDIVLGVAMTPTTVRMVLVEGENGDGVTVDHDVFDISAIEGGATTSPSDQVIAAVLGTQESALAIGHDLKSIGVAWNDHGEAAVLRDSLADRAIGDVLLVSELHAAASLAQAAGRAVGYDTTALLFIDRDAATLSVVQTDNGSIVKVLSRSLHSTDAMAVLTEMAAAVDAQSSPPQGMFVVGSGVDVTSVKAHLEDLVSMPVNAPEEPELALARGAALASAQAPRFESSTIALAYSQDPDGTTSGTAYPIHLASDATQIAAVGRAQPEEVAATVDGRPDESRKPFLLVGSAVTSIFVVGVVALVISLAVSIRPTVDQRPNPGQSGIVPSTQAPATPTAETLVPAAQAPPAPAPAPATIKEPVPVVQQAPRTVFVKPQAPAAIPAPAAPPPAPEAPPPPPIAPIAPIAPYVPPVVLPPPVIVLPPIFRPLPPPIYRPPVEDEYPDWQPRWRPPWNPLPPQYPPYPPYPQLPQQPQAPQYPQYPQYPQQGDYGPGSDGSDGLDGSGSGGGRGGDSRHDSGPGGSGLCLPLLGCTGH